MQNTQVMEAGNDYLRFAKKDGHAHVSDNR